MYLSFITDQYSKKILGYSLSESMRVEEILPSLEMAILSLKGKKIELIHHSDRGSQYCSEEYVSKLISKGIEISMTENGDPLENAVAERINGIIKGEYLKDIKIENITKGRKILERVISLYNNERPHLSCGYHTPNEIYEGKEKPKRVWKNYYKNKNTNILEEQEKAITCN